MGNDYSNAITIAAAVADLVHSEFWGTNEGTTIEDVEHTKAITAYAVQTGYMLHEVKETLLQVVHLEASDYDSEPEIHKEQALNCLQAIQGYEAGHNDHFRSLDVTTQIMEWVYKEETRDLYKPNRYWDVHHEILTGCQYEDLVKRPLRLHKWDTPYDKAVLSDIHNRLKYFEDKHRVSSAS